MNTSSCIVRNVVGKTTIHFDDTNDKTIGFVDPLFCRFGWVHHGDIKYSVKVTVLSFDSCGDSGQILSDNLSSLFEQSRWAYIALGGLWAESRMSQGQGRRVNTFLNTYR